MSHRLPILNAQDPSSSIYIAGHRGMVGSAIVRALERAGHTHLINRTHAELDLTDQAAVETFFAEQRPTQVYLAAAKVGGIHANDTYPAKFLYQNLLIEANILHAAWRHGVERLLFLNVGTGVDVTIAELAHQVADVVGFQGQLVFDPTKPDGTPRKLLDGIRHTYHWFLEHQGQSACRLSGVRYLSTPILIGL